MSGTRGDGSSLPAVLWNHRFLLLQLTRRTFLGRNAGTMLGWWWSLLATAIQLGMLWAVFSVILGIKVAEPAGVNFGIYLMTGLVPFLAVNDAAVAAVSLFRQNAALVQRVRFPLEVLVLSSVLGTLLHQALAFVVVVVVCVVAGVVAPAGFGWLMGGVFLLGLWALGLAALVSVGGAFLPDLGQGLGVVLQVVFYATPIVYPLGIVGIPALRAVLEANPMTVIVTMIRAFLIGAAPPGWMAVAGAVGGGVALLLAGLAALFRYKPRIPDVV